MNDYNDRKAIEIEESESRIAKNLKAMLDQAYMHGYSIAKSEDEHERLRLNADILASSLEHGGKCHVTMVQPDGSKARYKIELCEYSAENGFADIS